MPLLQLSNVSIAYGTHALLDKANFQLDAGESVGLLGRNGEGKSTMMKIIAGNILADEGEIWRQPELKLAWLEQAPTLTDGMSIYDAVAEGLGDLGHWISRYHHLSMHMEATDEKALEELGNLQHQLETHNGWHFQQ
ncbi:MAG: ATP-binding cassette domain-containing protein, partial [Methylococcales bacterium]|nr:ATP-binding cassette domain-containing protein [Methylococcales bacterium]